MFKFTSTGIRYVDFSLEDKAINHMAGMWKAYVENIQDYPTDNRFGGKGIVMCAGGLTYLTCAWVMINSLRALQCTLPIELWYLGNELSEEVIFELGKLNVVCKNFLNFGNTSLSGVMLKPLAIILSSFKEILFLDADNNCLRNPEDLFETPEYKKYGAIFWPDFWKTAPNNPIWAIIDCEEFEIPEQESGQVLVNKEKCWKELNLALYFNEKSKLYHRMLYGDKDTFKFAWHALNSKFHMIKKDVAACGYVLPNGTFSGTTMVQHDLNGEMLFLHRNLLKWDITRPGEEVWKRTKSFHDSTSNKILDLSYNVNGHPFIDLNGDIEYKDAGLSKVEQGCLSFLQQLRESPFYARFLIYSHLRGNRFHKHELI